MTFYNIIFGILFLFACRQAFLLFDTDVVWAAMTIAILVFNDSLNTSDALERELDQPRYWMRMKWIDLFSFLVLCVALVALEPSNNPFEVLPSDEWQHRLEGWTAWPFITLYWALALCWNWLAYPGDESFRRVSRALILLPFSVSICVAIGVGHRWLEIATFFAFLAYSLAKTCDEQAEWLEWRQRSRPSS